MGVELLSAVELNELRIRALEDDGFNRLDVCVCCLFLLANGDCGCADRGMPCTSAEDLASNWNPSRWRIMLGGSGDDYEGEGFSWSSCGGCENRLGGDRYEAWAYEIA